MLGDDRHVADPHLVVAEAFAHLGQELVVDPVDDLQMTGQQPAQQLHGPHLEGLGQQGVAGVGEALPGDRPGGVPVHLLLVDEDPHELGHGDHGVGVVELEDHPLGQLREIEAVGEHVVEEVVDRCRDEEVLLLQPQLLALRGGILRVQHLGDVLRERLRAHGLLVVAGVEDAQIERVRRLRAPQPERVHPAVLEPGDHVVVRHGLDVPGGDPAGARHAVVVVRLGGAAEGDRLGGLRVRELPGRAEREPGVGLLDLLAVHERLPEHAVLVADPVADARHAQGGQGVHETRGQAPEAAVAETRLDLLRAELVKADSAGGERRLGDLGQPAREQVVVELPAQQVLGGEVADALRLRLLLAAQILQPPRHQVVAHGVRQREVPVVRARRRQGDAPLEVEVVQEMFHEGIRSTRRRGHRGEREGMRGGGGFGHSMTIAGRW